MSSTTAPSNTARQQADVVVGLDQTGHAILHGRALRFSKSGGQLGLELELHVGFRWCVRRRHSNFDAFRDQVFRPMLTLLDLSLLVVLLPAQNLLDVPQKSHLSAGRD